MKREKGLVRLIVTEEEEELFQDFNSFLEEWYDKNEIDLLVVGGWVRDKLVGVDSRNLDFVVNGDDCSDFVDRFLIYLRENGKAAWGKRVIKANAAKCKFAETACLQVPNFDLDFNNFECQGDSTEGTNYFDALFADALRRDFTVNAIFYDVRTGQVIDPLEMGRSDLGSRLLRTTHDATTSLRTDPARFLRGARLLAKLELTATKAFLAAQADSVFRQKLHSQVDSQRIHYELRRILDLEDCAQAWQVILGDQDLADIVFGIYDENSEPDWAWKGFENLCALTPLMKVYSLSDEGRHTLKLSAILKKLGGPHENAPTVANGLAYRACRRRFPKKLSQKVAKVQALADVIHAILTEGPRSIDSRVADELEEEVWLMGLLLYEAIHGPLDAMTHGQISRCPGLHVLSRALKRTNAVVYF